MKIVTIKGLWLLHWCTKFHIDFSSRLWVIGVSNVENRTHTHTSGRQKKITFLGVLKYSEYSVTNISKKLFFSRKDSFFSEEAKKLHFLSQKLIFHSLKRNPSKKSRFFIIFVHLNVQNFRNMMYPRNFLCEEAKIKQRTSPKKELCESSEEAIWKSRFTFFVAKQRWR